MLFFFFFFFFHFALKALSLWISGLQRVIYIDALEADIEEKGPQSDAQAMMPPGIARREREKKKNSERELRSNLLFFLSSHFFSLSLSTLSST